MFSHDRSLRASFEHGICNSCRRPARLRHGSYYGKDFICSSCLSEVFFYNVRPRHLGAGAELEELW